MATPRIKISPYLNDFLYDVLFRATLAQKKALPQRYARKLKTNAGARKFVDNSYLEEKLEVLRGLGFSWYVTVFEDTRLSMKFARDVFASMKPDNGVWMSKSIAEKHLYVTSDRNDVYEQGLMADLSNSPQYAQSLLLNKAGYHIGKWKKQMKGPLSDTAKDHMDVTKYLVEMALNVGLQLEYVHDACGLTRNDFKVLCYLYIKKHTFVEYGQIIERLSGNLNLHKTTGCIRRLHQNGMITKTPKANEKKYQISGLGIKAISDFYKQVLKANEF